MVQESSNIISDYDLFCDLMPYTIWISGTNGKTTTTQMIQHILKEYGSLEGGNIGTALSCLDTSAPIWILETSSFSLHYTSKASPNLYILLPISQDHISWHGTYEEYTKSKLKAMDSMLEGEIAIIPEEFKDYPTNACKITYKTSDDLCSEFKFNKNEIKFKEPFLLDALLALAVKKILFDEKDYNTINTFVIDAHKVEELKDYQNRLWVNDSKATNADATINALSSYKDEKIYLILGGDDKGAQLETLFEVISSLDLEVYIVGSNHERLKKLCKKYNIKYFYKENLENTVIDISLKLDNKSTCIMSPAASSLDEYSSYAQRGNNFKEFVQNLS